MDKSALRPSPPEPRAKGQLREGISYAAHTTEIAVPLIMMGLVGTLAYEFTVSLPLFATRTFHGGSEAYGFMTAFMGIGAVAGGLITAARGRTGVRPVVLGAVGFGLAILFTALAPSLDLAYVGLLFVGWGSVSFVSVGNSTIQLSSKPTMRGRSLSLWQLAFQGTTPIGGPAIGWVISESEPRTGLLVGAASCFAAVAAGAALARRRRGHTDGGTADALSPSRPSMRAA
jgi:MFS family permease